MIFRRCCISGIFYGNETGDALKGWFTLLFSSIFSFFWDYSKLRMSFLILGNAFSINIFCLLKLKYGLGAIMLIHQLCMKAYVGHLHFYLNCCCCLYKFQRVECCFQKIRYGNLVFQIQQKKLRISSPEYYKYQLFILVLWLN